jgi:hypothetical protein
VYTTSLSNLSYIFDFTQNYESISNYGNKGPFRKFDIVVEAENAPIVRRDVGQQFVHRMCVFDAGGWQLVWLIRCKQ